MTEPTRGTINKNVLKAVDLAIENQKEINKQFEQLIMMLLCPLLFVRLLFTHVLVVELVCFVLILPMELVRL